MVIVLWDSLPVQTRSSSLFPCQAGDSIDQPDDAGRLLYFVLLYGPLQPARTTVISLAAMFVAVAQNFANSNDCRHPKRAGRTCACP